MRPLKLKVERRSAFQVRGSVAGSGALRFQAGRGRQPDGALVVGQPEQDGFDDRDARVSSQQLGGPWVVNASAATAFVRGVRLMRIRSGRASLRTKVGGMGCVPPEHESTIAGIGTARSAGTAIDVAREVVGTPKQPTEAPGRRRAAPLGLCKRGGAADKQRNHKGPPWTPGVKGD